MQYYRNPIYKAMYLKDKNKIKKWKRNRGDILSENWTLTNLELKWMAWILQQQR